MDLLGKTWLQEVYGEKGHADKHSEEREREREREREKSGRRSRTVLSNVRCPVGCS